MNPGKRSELIERLLEALQILSREPGASEWQETLGHFERDERTFHDLDQRPNRKTSSEAIDHNLDFSSLELVKRARGL